MWGQLSSGHAQQIERAIERVLGDFETLADADARNEDPDRFGSSLLIGFRRDWEPAQLRALRIEEKIRMFGSALTELAERLAERLIARGETIALVETTSGGLASAALLAVPGASAYFVGSAVAYSRKSRHALLSLSGSDVAGLEPMSEGMGIAFARRARTRMAADWGLAELGIAGPAGSPMADQRVWRWWR